ncbi:MAG: hypothetical protein JST32_04385 [Bacteroidetes bacterium]|nr:hypothetical protein [Bacteroidota bacterium]
MARILTPTLINAQKVKHTMIRNCLKVALRNLLKNKAHTFINIACLSVGLACSLLILLWVQSELSVDKFHTNRKSVISSIRAGKPGESLKSE